MTQESRITGKKPAQIASHNQNAQAAIIEANKKRKSNRFKKDYVHVEWADGSEVCLAWNEGSNTYEIAHLAYAYYSPDKDVNPSRSTEHRDTLKIMNS